VPDSNDDIETRVTILERSAHQLAVGADRDVSEVRSALRAHTQALNAPRNGSGQD
jgi:hypothetical protein